MCATLCAVFVIYNYCIRIMLEHLCAFTTNKVAVALDVISSNLCYTPRCRAVKLNDRHSMNCVSVTRRGEVCHLWVSTLFGQVRDIFITFVKLCQREPVNLLLTIMKPSDPCAFQKVDAKNIMMIVRVVIIRIMLVVVAESDDDMAMMADQSLKKKNRLKNVEFL